jgi:hypothetical protein
MSTVRVIFSFRGIPFRFVPSFGTGSSAELGMPRNEHFLLRNNGNRSEFSERNSVPNPNRTVSARTVHQITSKAYIYVLYVVFVIL